MAVVTQPPRAWWPMIASRAASSAAMKMWPTISSVFARVLMTVMIFSFPAAAAISSIGASALQSRRPEPRSSASESHLARARSFSVTRCQEDEFNVTSTKSEGRTEALHSLRPAAELNSSSPEGHKRGRPHSLSNELGPNRRAHIVANRFYGIFQGACLWLVEELEMQGGPALF